MEIQTSFFVSIFLVLLPLCFIIIKGYNKYAKSKQKLPPGPRKLPLIGNLHQLLCLGSSEFQPHVALSKLAAKYGPLMHLKLGQRLVLVVSSAEVSRQFFKTHDLTFSNRPELFVGKIMMYGFSDMAFAPYGDFWRQMRKICNSELLGLKRIHSFVPMMFDEVRDLVKSIAAAEVGKPIDLNERLSLLQFAITCKAAVGRTACTDQESFLMVMKEFVSFAGIFSAADLFPSWKIVQLISGLKRKLTKMHQKADHIVEQIIREHELKRGTDGDGDGKQIEEDIVDVLLRLKESKDFPIPITRNVIKATVFELFVAGTSTSATAMLWAFSELVKNPKMMKKAQAEVRQVYKLGTERIDQSHIQKLTYLRMVIKETLRIHPPGPLSFARESREESEIDGYTIPNKTLVLLNLWAVGRDPKHWENPETFDPDRFDGSPIESVPTHFEYTPFGAGRRICPGISFGMASVEVSLALLLYHFDWKLPSGMSPQELDMTEKFSTSLERKTKLCLIASPYVPVNGTTDSY
ncbi:desmethyl-deoxy-podophyllotoxin synthase-like [Nicotiana tomentosiformis]|uniref:desmethyl-deoxy-podophyllotoxin synthase-like n=1 Tax=Nicotiana tomentosiformis TaxID=4098 RepID=UPI00051AB612|nr:premnaspirodiene oxygenase-like [Nicotiana tomentosiformis]